LKYLSNVRFRSFSTDPTCLAGQFMSASSLNWMSFAASMPLFHAAALAVKIIPASIHG
jgi:hypothetical protein